MKKIFLLILTALAFASCTLYMDEPEDDKKGKDDNIENGDGFSAPRTDVTADGTTTYQFNPTTKVFDETNSQYVLNVEDSVVWLSTSTPYEMIPQVGDAIYSNFSETFPDAMIGKVVSVTKENGMIKCVCTDTTLGHVYKKLDIHASINVADYMDPAIADKSLAEKRRYAMQRTRDEGVGEPSKWDITVEVEGQKDIIKKNYASGSLSGFFKVRYLSLEYRKVDVDLSLEKSTFRFIFTDSTVVSWSYKAGCTASFDYTLLAVDSLNKGDVAAFPIKKKIEIPIGSTPIVFGLNPSIVASVSGTLEAIGVYRSTTVQEIGLIKTEKDKEPKGYKRNYEKSGFDAGNVCNGNLTLQIKANCEGYLAFKKLDRFAKAYISVTVGPQLKWSADTDVSDLGILVNKPNTIEAGINLDITAGARLQILEGKPLWNVNIPLFNKYFPILTWYVSPALINLEIIPLDYISDINVTKRRYRARATFVNAPKEFNPWLMIFDDQHTLIMTDGLKKKKTVVYNGTTIWEKEFEIDNKYNHTYYAMAGFDDTDNRMIYADKIPFGVKAVLELDKCGQYCSYTDFDNKRKPFGYEVRGVLKKYGSSAVTEWGIRFELCKLDGTKLATSQLAKFKLKDGKTSWGVRINTKKGGKYLLRAVPLFHTSYKYKRPTVLEDKAVEIIIDSEYGESRESLPDPEMYVDIEQTK